MTTYVHNLDELSSAHFTIEVQPDGRKTHFLTLRNEYETVHLVIRAPHPKDERIAALADHFNDVLREEEPV